MSKYTIGIDLGGTTMTAGLVDESYQIVGKVTWATRLPRPAEDLEQALADLCRTVAKNAGVSFSDVRYVGIGTVITAVGGEGALRCRLLDMGLTPRAQVTLQKIAPMGDPIQIQLRGYELTIRREDARKITLREDTV